MFWSRNYIKFYNPKAIVNKLDIKYHVEKQLGAKIVHCCMHIRNSYPKYV